MTAARAERPPRLGADLVVASEGARMLYTAGAQRVWICGSLAHGRHWDEQSDLDFATLGLSEARRLELSRQLAARSGRSVDVIGLEDAPSFLRVQISHAMIPMDRLGRAARVTRGLLEPPVTTLTSRPLPRSLHRQREAAVLDVLERAGSRDVLDVGCGQGRLLGEIVGRGAPSDGVRATGLDPDASAIAAARVHLSSSLTGEQLARVTLHNRGSGALQSLWRGQDALVAVEVIEHLDLSSLLHFAGLVFEVLRPRTVAFTTPNADFNALLPGRGLRDADHRFEWGRDEFRAWSLRWARAGGYSAACSGVGEPHAELGSPSQLGHFTRRD